MRPGKAFMVSPTLCHHSVFLAPTGEAGAEAERRMEEVSFSCAHYSGVIRILLLLADSPTPKTTLLILVTLPGSNYLEEQAGMPC